MILRIFILPMLSGLLYWLSSPACSFPLVVWLCLVPFGLSLYRSTPRNGLASGFVYGLCLWFSAVWWLKINLVGLVGLPPWQAWGWTFVFCAWHAIPYALFGYVAVRCRWLERPLGSFFAAAALVLIRIWYPAIFPGNEAHNLYEWPLLIQVLDLGGVPLLLFCVYLVNFLFVRALLCWREKISPLPAIICVAVIAALLTGYGGYRLNQVHGEMAAASDKQRITIVSVQPNMPVNPNARDIPPGMGLYDMNAVLAFTRQAALSHPKRELVVLPELPCGYTCSPEEAGRDMPRLVADTGIAVMIPCAAVAAPAVSLYYNSVAYADKHGTMGEQYRKNILVPFGEYIPLERRFPFLRRLFPGVMPFVPGDKVVLYDLGKGRQGIPALCYEAVFTGHIRRFVERGGNVLINMVDDAWFGNSPASLTHFSLAVYRAVEYRVPMVRVTNSGVGAFVQPTGEIVAGTKTGLFERVVTGTELFIPLHRSLYFRIGDVFLYSLLLALAVDALPRRWNKYLF